MPRKLCKHDYLPTQPTTYGQLPTRVCRRCKILEVRRVDGWAPLTDPMGRRALALEYAQRLVGFEPEPEDVLGSDVSIEQYYGWADAKGRRRNYTVVVAKTNAPLIAEVARLYAPRGSRVVDLTPGRGNWWRLIYPGVPTDLALDPAPMCSGRQ